MDKKVRRKSAKDEVLNTLEKRKVLPVDSKTFNRLLQLTSGRIYDPLIQELPDGTYEVKYTKKTGTDEARFIFPNLDKKQFRWIVKKVKTQTKEGEKVTEEILNFDNLTRKVLLIELLFAWGAGSAEFVYRPWDMLYWLGMTDHKKGKTRDRVTSITHALALATVVIKNKTGEETRITHIMSLVDRGKGRKQELEVFLHKDAMMPLWPALMKQLKKEGKLPQTVGYPVPALAYRPKRPAYAHNFIDWARKHKGMGQIFFPMKVETVLTEAMRMTPEQIKDRTKRQLEDILDLALVEGKKDEVTTGWRKSDAEELSKSRFLKSKIKVWFPEKRRQLFEYPHSVDEKATGGDVSEDKQVTEIAKWLHQEEFGTKRDYETSIKMLREARRRLGQRELQKTFHWISEESNNPHPKAFWDEIEKDLRKKRRE